MNDILGIILNFLIIAGFGYILFDVHRNVQIIREELKKPEDGGED